MMTLALLLTAVTGAWAESKPIGLNVEYAVGDEITSTTNVYVWSGYFLTPTIIDPVEGVIMITSNNPATISEIANHEQTGYITLNSNREVISKDGITNLTTDNQVQCQGKVTGTLEKVHVVSGSGTLADPYVFAPGSAPAAATPVPLTWDAATPNTATLTNGMPAGNVTVSVEYFPQAEFAMSTDATPVALAPTAIDGVPANTDDPIVTPGTVANIGTSDDKQGTLMYFVIQPTGNTDPVAPTYDTKGWTDKVPTADGLAQGDAYVWYYIKGAEPANIADRTDANTGSDSDIKPLGTNGIVTLAAEPTYDVTLNDEGLYTDEAAAWKVAKGTDDPAAFPLEGVKKTETVTVTYSGTKKVIGVKAAKVVVAEGHALTSAKLGEIVCSDGKAYAAADKDILPKGVKAEALVCYANGGHGLALALTDEGEMDWSTAQNTCAARTATFTGGTWKLASQGEWNNMINAAGGFGALRDGFSSVGGTNMQSDRYWSSTDDDDRAQDYNFSVGEWDDDDKTWSWYVRACLAF